MTHTPTPWKVYHTTDGRHLLGIGDAEAGGITDPHFALWRDGDEAKANAEFIVRACNAHDELVKALRNCERVLAAMHRDGWGVGGDVLSEARAALSKAEGR